MNYWKIIGLKTIRCIVNLCPIYNELNIRSKNDLDINWPSLKDLKVKWDAQTNLHRLTRVNIEGRHSIKTHFRKGSMEEKRLKIGLRFFKGNILKVKKATFEMTQTNLHSRADNKRQYILRQYLLLSLILRLKERGRPLIVVSFS